jgi:hypothetical protein
VQIRNYYNDVAVDRISATQSSLKFFVITRNINNSCRITTNNTTNLEIYRNSVRDNIDASVFYYTVYYYYAQIMMLTRCSNLKW